MVFLNYKELINKNIKNMYLDSKVEVTINKYYRKYGFMYIFVENGK